MTPPTVDRKLTDAWDVVRLRWLCRSPPAYGANIRASEYASDGVRLVRTSDILASGRDLTDDAVFVPPELASEAMLEPGDLLLSRSGTVGRAFLYDSPRHGPCAHAGYLIRFATADAMIPEFLLYYLKSRDFELWTARGTIESTIGNLNAARYGRLPVPTPPLATQARIVSLLDRETTRIDRLIERKERLIALLEEKRSALITRAVTKGLDPDVSMKDSGVEWIGRIPGHWEVSRLRRIARVVDCKHQTPSYVQDGYPLVSTTEVKPGILDLSRCTRFVDQVGFDDMTEGPRRPRRGDIMYSRNASIGQAALVASDEPFCMGQDIVLIRSDRIDSRFLNFQLNSSAAQQQVEALGVGSTFSRINVSMIRDMLLAVPPEPEQPRLSSALADIDHRITQLIAAASQSVSLLRERRSVLITAAVTGQLKVEGCDG